MKKEVNSIEEKLSTYNVENCLPQNYSLLIDYGKNLFGDGIVDSAVL